MNFIKVTIDNKPTLINTNDIQSLKILGDEIICRGSRCIDNLVIYKGKHFKQVFEDIFETIGNNKNYDLDYLIENCY